MLRRTKQRAGVALHATVQRHPFTAGPGLERSIIGEKRLPRLFPVHSTQPGSPPAETQPYMAIVQVVFVEGELALVGRSGIPSGVPLADADRIGALQAVEEHLHGCAVNHEGQVHQKHRGLR
jgi:hypothetical protein